MFIFASEPNVGRSGGTRRHHEPGSLALRSELRGGLGSGCLSGCSCCATENEHMAADGPTALVAASLGGR